MVFPIYSVCKQLIQPKYWLVYGAMVLSTYVLVVSGWDYQYFLWTQKYLPRPLLLITDTLGYVVPVLVPAVLFGYAWLRRDARYTLLAQAMITATAVAWVLSTFLKAISGRESPPHLHQGATQLLADTSANFTIGFSTEQLLGGWPSSHATVLMAMATTLVLLTPSSWRIRIVAYGIALSIGVGVSFGWHWLSEFVAGTLLGVTIGKVVALAYKSKR